MTRFRPRAIWLLLPAAVAALWIAQQFSWATRFPKAWELPVAKTVSKSAAVVTDNLSWLTRLFATAIEVPMTLVVALLSEGGALTLGGFALDLPPLSWSGLALAVVWLGWRTGGPGLALLQALGCAYLLFFGQWSAAMLTLASVVIAVPFALGAGVVLGIVAWRMPRLDRWLVTPVLDLMQTVPAFAYLVPTLVLFGFGPVSALIATVIFALPPMARVTTLALSRLPGAITDLAAMMGCTRGQALWRVLLPAAMPMLLVGLNQTVMMTLNMVIIASMIGAGGLGFDVLLALRQLDIGRGLEAGAAIVVLAIMLDRQGRVLASGWSRGQAMSRRRGLGLVLVLGALLGTTLLGQIHAPLRVFPESWQVTTGSTMDSLVAWLNVNFFDTIEAVRVFLLMNLMNPIRIALASAPWLGVMTIVAMLGWVLGGWRLAVLGLGVGGFCLVTGLWDETMTTIYLCLTAAILSVSLGVPLGIAGHRWPRFGKLLTLAVELLQTMPSFVYLIPVVMLLRVGDVSAMIAIVAFAVTPVIRYTMAAFEAVPPALTEAGTVMGCTSGQMLRHVQLPVALPTILLGINQCFLFSLAMVVITALVGTRDLGQKVYIALTKADVGSGLVAGLCLGLVGILVDRLFRAAAARIAPQEPNSHA